ncbi:hypothetical protein GGP41_005996 [Bipolaris sorokiniana]|uniref:Uncharacterized protein n=1 Tax=Cochliobolus sativus TaxID=45130 RepID=A0A8H5ZF56_COCSA|nr:hypothetical protein GGP41_005996 [Bipolaris sorokiniana]
MSVDPMSTGNALRILSLASTEKLPCCSLAVLNKQMPACRLHVHGLDFHGLHQRDTLQDVGDDD